MPNTILQPPADDAAEQAVIGACLIDPDAINAARSLLTPSDFYLSRHATIFQAMSAIRADSQRVDYVTLTAYLDAHSQLDSVGGAIYLGQLISQTATAFHVAEYARIVKDKAARRSAIALAGEMARAAYDETSDLEAQRGAWLTRLLDSARIEGGATHIARYVSELVKLVEAQAQHPNEIFGLKTDIAGFDTALGGLQKGETLLLCGEPGRGKTMLATQTLCNIAAQGIPVALYEMDTRWTTIVRRMISLYSKVPTSAMRSGYMNEHWEQFYDAAGRVSAMPIYYSEATHWTTAAMRADLTRLKDKHGVEAFGLDYLGQLRDVVGRDHDPNVRDKFIANELKRMPRDLDMSAVIVHTINKTGMRNQTPSLADASGSGENTFAFENVAFLTSFIPHSKEESGYSEDERANLVTVTYSKQRDNEDSAGYFHLVSGKDIHLPMFRTYARKSQGGF